MELPCPYGGRADGSKCEGGVYNFVHHFLDITLYYWHLYSESRALMDLQLHDVRNDLAVGIGSIHAHLDGKRELSTADLRLMLELLERVDAALDKRPPSAEASDLGSETLLVAIIEGSPFAKILVDEQGTIILINAETERLFGYERSELLGRPIEVLVPTSLRGGHPALRDIFAAEPVARPMGGGRVLYGVQKDGNQIPVEVGLNPIVSGNRSYTLAAVIDISERMHAEALRLLNAGMQERAIKLEALNQQLINASTFKSQFVSTMSHELRTPLAAIIGAVELLARYPLDERSAACVTTINESAVALFALINNVLDFSKLEAGKVELHEDHFEVEAVLEGAADVVAELARAKGIGLHTYVDPDIPPLIGDATRLRQIVLNLLGNAVKFTDRGEVVARAVPLLTSGRDLVLRLEVQDTGIGMSHAAQHHLFEPFVSSEQSTVPILGGTGLGLTIARNLVELMGGEIGVSSEPGRGSTFWFTARFTRDADAVPRKLEGLAAVIITGDDTFAQIVEGYLRSWSMESRRVDRPERLLEVVQSVSHSWTERNWVAIVDVEGVDAVSFSNSINIIRAIMPSRVITVGNEGKLRKPLHQSHLFEAILAAMELVMAPPRTNAARYTIDDRDAADDDELPGAILVAEDNEKLQALLQLQFEELDVPVVFVPNGLAAVEAMRERRFALVFMDCQMPILDGLAATRAIREEEQRAGQGRVPICAMTASAFAEDRDACLAAGMDDYLAKPVKIADLDRIVRRWARTDYGVQER